MKCLFVDQCVLLEISLPFIDEGVISGIESLPENEITRGLIDWIAKRFERPLCLTWIRFFTKVNRESQYRLVVFLLQATKPEILQLQIVEEALCLIGPVYGWKPDTIESL